MGCHPSHWLSYFSEGLKPPTRIYYVEMVPPINKVVVDLGEPLSSTKSCKSVKRPLPPFLHSISSYPFISYIHDMGMICLDQIWLNECILVLLCLLLQKWTRRWSFWTCYFRGKQFCRTWWDMVRNFWLPDFPWCPMRSSQRSRKERGP